MTTDITSGMQQSPEEENPAISAEARRRTYTMPPLLSRGEFLDIFAEQYACGQHVTFIGPTQRGKTTLCHQMLAQVCGPDCPAYVIALKPPGRDPQMAAAPKRLNLNLVNEYPSKTRQRIARKRNRNGFVVRPDHVMHDHKATRTNLKRVTGETLNECYASKQECIVVLDETHITQNDLGLKDEIEAPLMRGAPVVSVWCLIQRGRYITYQAYCAPEWMILYFDPDSDNQKRYGDIGGVDPRLIRYIVSRLRTMRGDDGKSTISQALCIRRSGPEIFLIDTN